MKENIRSNAGAKEAIKQIDGVTTHVVALNKELEKTSRLLQQVTGRNEEYVTHEQLQKTLKAYAKW